MVSRRRWLLCAALFCALAIAGLLPGVALGQQKQPPVIAILDMQRILRESVAVKDMQQEIDGLRSSYQDELRGREESLRAADQELSRQRAVLSADAYAKKRQELEQQVATVQREIQERRDSMEKLFGGGMDQVRQVLVEVVSEIAKEQDVDLVLSKATVVLVKPELEITDEALVRLNQRLPKLSLSVPQN